MMKRKNPHQFVGLAAAVIGLLALLAILALNLSAAQSMPQPQAGPADTDPQVLKLKSQLKRDDLSPETRAMLDEKRIMAERMALERIDPDPRPVEERGPKVAPPLAEPLLAAPVEPLWEGIFEGSEGMVRPSVAQIQNGWQGSRGGSVFQVFVGATAQEPARGVLLGAQIANDQPAAARDTYLAPDGAASLRILEVDENGLLLETDTENRLYFDLATRQFQPVE